MKSLIFRCNSSFGLHVSKRIVSESNVKDSSFFAPMTMFSKTNEYEGKIILRCLMIAYMYLYKEDGSRAFLFLNMLERKIILGLLQPFFS